MTLSLSFVNGLFGSEGLVVVMPCISAAACLGREIIWSLALANMALSFSIGC